MARYSERNCANWTRRKAVELKDLKRKESRGRQRSPDSSPKSSQPVVLTILHYLKHRSQTVRWGHSFPLVISCFFCFSPSPFPNLSSPALISAYPLSRVLLSPLGQSSFNHLFNHCFFWLFRLCSQILNSNSLHTTNAFWSYGICSSLLSFSYYYTLLTTILHPYGRSGISGVGPPPMSEGILRLRIRHSAAERR